MLVIVSVPGHTLTLSVPTPVRQLHVAALRGKLWLKDDGLSHALYGGNKTRKAAVLLEQASQLGAQRVFTFGAAGSHHVLATALFARDFGLRAAAVLTPQPSTDHARAVLARSLNAGLEAYPAGSSLGALLALLRHRQRGDYVVPPGGSNAYGARAYALAFSELEAQVAAGELLAPDWIVLPLGSGGTAAGILAGLSRSPLPTRLLAVSALGNPFAAAHVRLLARRALSMNSTSGVEPESQEHSLLVGPGSEQHPPLVEPDSERRSVLVQREPQRHSRVMGQEWKRRLVVDNRQIGRGYGRATSAGDQATEIAEAHGLKLDPTYTAKAFAAALALARGEHWACAAPGRVLYWHTLSATEGGPAATEPLPPELARLFVSR